MVGYYAAMEDVVLKDAQVKDKEGFLNKVKEKCHYGFGPDNCEISFDGDVMSLDFREAYFVWKDEMAFKEILREYLTEGSVYMSFAGEDGYCWSFHAFPGCIVEVPAPDYLDWRDMRRERFDRVIEDAPEKTKDKMTKEYKLYWEGVIAQAKENIKGLK